jgi:YidC/Oxa1 family membrane protein insertase
MFSSAIIAMSVLGIAECFHSPPSFALSSLRTNAFGKCSLRTAVYEPARISRVRRTSISAVVEGVDHVNTILNSVDASTLTWIHNLFLIADTAIAADPSGAAAGAAAAADATAAAAKASPGLYDSFVNVIEQSLILLHSTLKSASLPGAWGVSIILFTVLVKAVTYPLNYKQMASTIQMQNLQPKIKALQSRYQSDPQKLNELTAKLYQDEKINPLAGCIPTLIQIPIFIALYRSLLDLAKKDLLAESFLWIPSLEGPVGEYSPTTGLPIDGTAWLFKGWADGHPSMGWENTLAYLSIPIILVITQSLSQKVLQPAQSDDPAQQQTQQILKFLPLMIGWFSLNVPAGLGVYWVINNLLSTGQQWYIRQQVKAMQPAGAGAAVSSVDDSIRDKLKESGPKLRPADELKFKVSKKAEGSATLERPAAAVVPSPEAQPESTDDINPSAGQLLPPPANRWHAPLPYLLPLPPVPYLPDAPSPPVPGTIPAF